MSTENKSATEFEFETVYDRLPLINELIAKYQKKFAEIGNITYTKEDAKIKIWNESSEKFISIDGLKIVVSVDITTLKHDGWKYIGTIESVPVLNDKEEFTEYENIVYSNDKNFANRYKNEKLRCDHCNTNHQRKTVHVFKNEEKEIMIGTACSKEYFGIDVFKDLNKILSVYIKITDLQEEFERLGFGGFGIDKHEYCKIVYGIITEDKKYISAKSCEFNFNTPTSRIADNVYSSKEKEMYDLKIKILTNLKDVDILEKVRNYWNSKENDDTFTYNVQMTLKMLNPKTGLLAYAVYEYMKEVEDFTGIKKLNAIKKQSEYIGSIGEKIKNQEIECLKISSVETKFGTMYIALMIDNNQNIIVWKSGSMKDNIETGMKKIIKTAIIKEHTEYNGRKQTIIKNVKFED